VPSSSAAAIVEPVAGLVHIGPIEGIAVRVVPTSVVNVVGLDAVGDEGIVVGVLSTVVKSEKIIVVGPHPPHHHQSHMTNPVCSLYLRLLWQLPPAVFPFAPCTWLRKIHALCFGGVAWEHKSYVVWVYLGTFGLPQFFLACSCFHPSIITPFSRSSAPSYWISLILNFLMYAGVFMFMLGTAFIGGGVLCIVCGLLINSSLLYVGIAFCVVGGILFCCGCANCSSLNMPFVLVYQWLN